MKFKLKFLHDKKILVKAIMCVIILVFGISTFIIVSSIKPKPKRKSSERLIKTLITIPVKKETFREEITGYGTAEPARQIDVSSQINGAIIYVAPYLKNGTLVKKNEILAKIEKADYEIALKKAISDINSNKSKLEVQIQEIKYDKMILKTIENKLRLAEADYNRQKQLFQKKVVSAQYFENAEETLNEHKQTYLRMKSDIAEAELNLNALKSDIERADAEKSQAELNIKRCDIKSPIDGRLEDVTVEKDEYMTMGEKLFRVADDSTLSIPVSLDIRDASAIIDVVPRGGNSYKHWFRIYENVSVTIRWAETPDKCVWKGKISRIEKFDPQTRTITVVVEPVEFIGDSETTLPLVAGMHCKVEFLGKELKDVIKAPWAALQLDGNIYIVDNKGIVHERKVNILNARQDKVIVSSGLNEGEDIIIQRIPYGVVNGTKVKTESVSSAPETKLPESIINK